jgi:hypothetical protein
MNGPRRLSQSGGVSQRLLASASIDKPSAASRRRVAAATASAFALTHAGGSTRRVPPNPGNATKTLATWALIGAAATGVLALFGSRFLDSGTGRSSANQSAPAMSVLAPANDPGIASEPASPPRLASADEAQQIAAARTALSHGDANGALAQLNAYARAYPNGALKPESMALQIEALKKSGRTAEARAVADEFLRKYPGRVLTQ